MPLELDAALAPPEYHSFSCSTKPVPSPFCSCQGNRKTRLLAYGRKESC